MQLRALLLALAAAGCVTDADSEIDIVTDDPAVTPDRELSAEDDRTGSPDRAVEDEYAFSGSHGKLGWAFGVGIGASATATELVVPNTDTKNPDALVTTAPHPAVSEAAFSVSAIKLSSSRNEAQATTSQLAITLPGLVIRATDVKAVATATQTSSGRSTSTAGSVINNLVINGVSYGNVAQSNQSIPVAGIGDVTLLARTTLANGVAMDAIRVRVFDQPATPVNEALEIVVSHAEAYYPSVTQH